MPERRYWTDARGRNGVAVSEGHGKWRDIASGQYVARASLGGEPTAAQVAQAVGVVAPLRVQSSSSSTAASSSEPVAVPIANERHREERPAPTEAITLVTVATHDNPADALTKPLAHPLSHWPVDSRCTPCVQGRAIGRPIPSAPLAPAQALQYIPDFVPGEAIAQSDWPRRWASARWERGLFTADAATAFLRTSVDPADYRLLDETDLEELERRHRAYAAWESLVRNLLRIRFARALCVGRFCALGSYSGIQWNDSFSAFQGNRRAVSDAHVQTSESSSDVAVFWRECLEWKDLFTALLRDGSRSRSAVRISRRIASLIFGFALGDAAIGAASVVILYFIQRAGEGIASGAPTA